jgi:hypothetical protein
MEPRFNRLRPTSLLGRLLRDLRVTFIRTGDCPKYFLISEGDVSIGEHW